MAVSWQIPTLFIVSTGPNFYRAAYLRAGLEPLEEEPEPVYLMVDRWSLGFTPARSDATPFITEEAAWQALDCYGGGPRRYYTVTELPRATS